MNSKSTIENLAKICRASDLEGFMNCPPKGVLDEFSGSKLVGLIQRFTHYFSHNSASTYVEIGIYQGLTLLANAFANPLAKCIGIDNFSLFNEGLENKSIVKKRMDSLGVHNAQVIDMDFEDGLRELPALNKDMKVNVFFVDGAHDYRSQLVPLLRIKPLMAANGVIIIDDANYPHVRQATIDFLESEPEYALLCEAYTEAHPANLSGKAKEEALAGWWNGVNVLVHDPDHVLKRSLPPQSLHKHLHLATHDIFRNRYAELSFEILKNIEVLTNDEPWAAVERTRLKNILENHRLAHPLRFNHQNTFSKGLPSFNVYS